MSEENQNKLFVRLRDTSTSFFDVEQNAGVVADRIAILRPTAKVIQFIGAGSLIELKPEEAKPLYSKQQKELRAAGVLPPKEPKVEEVQKEAEESLADDTDPPVEDADVTAAPKKQAAPKK